MGLNIFQSFILGIVEGLTEFIPVSSTAHLIFARSIFDIPETLTTDVFIISIQSGAILAALWYFWKAFVQEKAIFFKIAVAFIPTAIVGLLLSDVIHSAFKNKALIGIALILGGIIFLCLPDKKREVEGGINQPQFPAIFSWKQTFLLGFFQIFAFIPGVSRSGALLIGGALTKLSRKQVALFSFLLALLTILGATVVDIAKNKSLINGEIITMIIIGSIVALIVSIFTMNFFLKFLEKKNALKYFGVYRIVIGVLALLFLQ